MNIRSETKKLNKARVVLHLNVIFRDIEQACQNDTVPALRRGAKDFITKVYKLNKYQLVVCFEDYKYMDKISPWLKAHGIERYFSQIIPYEKGAAFSVTLTKLAHQGFGGIYRALNV